MNFGMYDMCADIISITDSKHLLEIETRGCLKK